MSEASAHRTTWQVAVDLLSDPVTRTKLKAFAYSCYGIAVDDAEDLLQETALELLHHESHVRKPEGYVFTVFKSKCGRHVAKLALARRLFSADEVSERPGNDGSAEIERFLALRQGFGEVTVQCRRLLSAYILEGRSLKETADACSLSPASIFKLVSRCLRKLRRCLA